LTGDFDDDGRADIVSINAAGGHRLYRNSSAANLAFVLHTEQFSTAGAVAAAAGDLNGDGRIDVAVARADAVAVVLNEGHGGRGRGDEPAPAVSLVGEPAVTVTVGEGYGDAGAAASDDVDGDLADRIVVETPGDAAVIGTDTVSYHVTDLSGNAAPTLT